MRSHLIPSMADPRELRVIKALIAEGFDPDEICKWLRMSKATYYRRKQEIDHDEREARTLMHADV